MKKKWVTSSGIKVQLITFNSSQQHRKQFSFFSHWLTFNVWNFARKKRDRWKRERKKCTRRWKQFSSSRCFVHYSIVIRSTDLSLPFDTAKKNWFQLDCHNLQSFGDNLCNFKSKSHSETRSINANHNKSFIKLILEIPSG